MIAARKTAVAALIALAALLASEGVRAGPPFLTDDPEPTDTGHWEIYGPQIEAAGRGSRFDGAFGAELNYGAAHDLQLTMGVPLSFTHDGSGLQVGRGDLELSAKYRFFHSEAADISIATFPGITIPTASHGMGNPKVTALLPIWAQKNAGSWSVFGGGGYAINPGKANRDYWTGGIALTRDISEHLLVGIEADRQGADTVGGRAQTSIGIGAILKLRSPFRILASAGPTFIDGDGAAGFHSFIALGIDF